VPPFSAHHDLAPVKDALAWVRQRIRVLQLVEVAEHAGIAPIHSRKLHAFAYLADVLSPVWGLTAFDGKVLKVEGGPHYPDLQCEMDRLVVLGLLNITDIQYVGRGSNGARMEARYSLNFESPYLASILDAIGSGDPSKVFDPKDTQINAFLFDLAGALATVNDADIDDAATVDVTYADNRISYSNVVDFGEWTENVLEDNLSYRTINNFDRFVPSGVGISGGQRLYMYASLLGRRINAR